MAMANPHGLVVPNIKNCQSKTILETANNLNHFEVKGQEGQLTPDDLADGTFSISVFNIEEVVPCYCIMALQGIDID